MERPERRERALPRRARGPRSQEEPAGVAAPTVERHEAVIIARNKMPHRGDAAFLSFAPQRRKPSSFRLSTAGINACSTPWPETGTRGTRLPHMAGVYACG